MRDSLADLLENAGYEIRAYSRAEELLARGRDIEPGCVISDMRMPGMDGLTLLRHLRAGGPILPLVLITGHGDISMAVTAMKAGAADFLEKPFEADTLLDAVGAALRHHLSEANAENTGALPRRLQDLTAREYEVFEHLVAGRSNKEVAAQLGISSRTVEFHRAHIMEKTGAKGIPELIRIWLARN